MALKLFEFVEYFVMDNFLLKLTQFEKTRLIDKTRCVSRIFSRGGSKLVYTGAKGVFRKVLVSVNQKGISKNRKKWGPFLSESCRIPEKRASAPHPNPPLY